jgi:hypothetical protein
VNAPLILACVAAELLDPVTIDFSGGPTSAIHRACPRSELSFGLSGGAIIRTEEFYGNLRAASVLAGSFALDEETQLSAAIELVRYQQVISSLSAEHFGLGHLALGGSTRVLSQDESALAIALQATLPTAFGLYSRTYPWAFDAGLAGTSRIGDLLELHGYLGGAFSFGTGAGPADPRFGLILSGGASFLISEALAIAVDVENSAGQRAVIDHLAVGLALRAAVAEGVRVELLAKAPFAGDERALLSAYLGVAYSR